MIQKNQKNSVDLLDKRIEVVLNEYNILREEMKMFLEFQRRDVQVFGGLLGGLIGIYYSNTTIFDVNIFTLVIPSFIFIYWCFQIRSSFMVSVEAKACARIESRINLLLNGKLVDWESVIARQYVRGLASPMPLITGAITLLSTFVFIAFSMKAVDVYGKQTLILHGVELFIIALATILWGVFEAKRQLPKPKI